MDDAPPTWGTAGTQLSHTEQVANVLALVVQRLSAGGRHREMCLRDVCALLQTCSTIRRSLQQTGAQYSVLLFCLPQETRSFSEVAESEYDSWLAAFTDWLPTHRSLVNHLRLVHQGSLAGQQLAALLRLCRLQAAADGLPPLDLQACGVRDVPIPALMRELAAVNLQRLYVREVDELAQASRMPAFSELLQRLTALQVLCLQTDSEQGVPSRHALASDTVMVAISQLTRLTRLTYGAFNTQFGAHRLPPPLKHLSIVTCEHSSDCEIADISHLTSLTELYWSDYGLATAALMLPATLTSIGTVSRFAYAPPASLTGASALQLISVCVDQGDEGLGFLSCLAGLPSLSELRLKLHDSADDTLCTEAGRLQAAAAIGAVTSLTRLALALYIEEGEEPPAIDWCGPLSRLPRLQSLMLHDFPVCQDGILQLSALTSLTHLYMWEVGLETVTAVALALRMAHLPLQHWHVTGQFDGQVLMPAVANMTSLGRLYVNGMDALVTDRELLMLTSLKHLSYLNLRGNQCSDAGKQRLVARLPELSEVLSTCADVECLDMLPDPILDPRPAL